MGRGKGGSWVGVRGQGGLWWVSTGSNMIFEKCSTQTHGHTNTNPAKNTKIGLLYLIEIAAVRWG